MKEGSGKTKQLSKLVDWEIGGAIYRRTRFGATGDMISFGMWKLKRLELLKWTKWSRTIDDWLYKSGAQV